ncbi:hypothetical protein K439DRAFT_1626419 [Ramaria rubella]|nr:hypothetical protein K439DRAFT_1626419 [Ramaria rubella]
MDRFDEATKKELAVFLEKEQGHARLQSSIHTFTSMCWDKCITGTPGNHFSRSEADCLKNCVERFLDTSLFMVRRLDQIRNGQ